MVKTKVDGLLPAEWSVHPDLAAGVVLRDLDFAGAQLQHGRAESPTGWVETPGRSRCPFPATVMRVPPSPMARSLASS